MAKYYFNEKENADWLAKLPKKSVATKSIIKSDTGKILLVKPNYKPRWQLPGGGVEAGEDPRKGLVRELTEELNFQAKGSDFKLLDTVFRQDHDNLILIYEYLIAIDESDTVQVQEDELETYKFEEPQNVGPLLSDYYAQFWEAYLTAP